MTVVVSVVTKDAGYLAADRRWSSGGFVTEAPKLIENSGWLMASSGYAFMNVAGNMAQLPPFSKRKVYNHSQVYADIVKPLMDVAGKFPQSFKEDNECELFVVAAGVHIEVYSDWTFRVYTPGSVRHLATSGSGREVARGAFLASEAAGMSVSKAIDDAMTAAGSVISSCSLEYDVKVIR